MSATQLLNMVVKAVVKAIRNTDIYKAFNNVLLN